MIEKHLSVADSVVERKTIYRVAHHHWPELLVFKNNKESRKINVLIYRTEAVLYGNQFVERMNMVTTDGTNKYVQTPVVAEQVVSTLVASLKSDCGQRVLSRSTEISPEMLNNTDLVIPPTIHGVDCDVEIVTRKKCREGMRTLGVRLSPLGNFLDEHAYRLLQFKGLAQNIQSSPISRFDAYLGYVTILQRMLHYPLGATCWNSKQCRQIDASFTGAIIAKMGFNRNTARLIIFGPIDQGGGMGAAWRHRNHARSSTP
jgi:hypothetical protein